MIRGCLTVLAVIVLAALLSAGGCAVVVVHELEHVTSGARP